MQEPLSEQKLGGNQRAEAAAVSDYFYDERVPIDVACDYDCNSRSAGGLEPFQRDLATMQIA